MAKQIGDIAALAFIVFVGLLTVTGIFSIWGVFDGQILYKSVVTMMILGGATIVTLVFAHFAEGSSGGMPQNFNQ